MIKFFCHFSLLLMADLIMGKSTFYGEAELLKLPFEKFPLSKVRLHSGEVNTVVIPPPS